MPGSAQILVLQSDFLHETIVFSEQPFIVQTYDIHPHMQKAGR